MPVTSDDEALPSGENRSRRCTPRHPNATHIEEHCHGRRTGHHRYTDVRQLSPGTLLTQEEVALICRVKPETVKKWRTTKKGPRAVPVARERLY